MILSWPYACGLEKIQGCENEAGQIGSIHINQRGLRRKTNGIEACLKIKNISIIIMMKERAWREEPRSFRKKDHS